MGLEFYDFDNKIMSKKHMQSARTVANDKDKLKKNFSLVECHSFHLPTFENCTIFYIVRWDKPFGWIDYCWGQGRDVDFSTFSLPVKTLLIHSIVAL